MLKLQIHSHLDAFQKEMLIKFSYLPQVSELLVFLWFEGCGGVNTKRDYTSIGACSVHLKFGVEG